MEAPSVPKCRLYTFQLACFSHLAQRPSHLNPNAVKEYVVRKSFSLLRFILRNTFEQFGSSLICVSV